MKTSDVIAIHKQRRTLHKEHDLRTLTFARHFDSDHVILDLQLHTPK